MAKVFVILSDFDNSSLPPKILFNAYAFHEEDSNSFSGFGVELEANDTLSSIKFKIREFVSVEITGANYNDFSPQIVFLDDKGLI